VGKTAVGWAIYSRELAGEAVGFVDIDQLGICYPESPSDPDRHRLKARNLDAVLSAFADSGAGGVIVSGVVESTYGILRGEIPAGAVTLCRLRADSDALARRFVERSSPPPEVDRIQQAADALESSGIADLVVETTGATIREVTARVLGESGWEPKPSRPRDTVAESLPSPFERVIWLDGVTGVGKSIVGFAVFGRLLRSGIRAAYLDSGQIGFCRPPLSDPCRAALVNRLWRNFAGAGARAVVAVGSRPATVAVNDHVWLRAGPETLRGRILERGRAGSWHEPGDPLLGRSQRDLLAVVERASTDAEKRPESARRVDTDGLSVGEVVDEVLRTASTG
jgi:hypothetical protein